MDKHPDYWKLKATELQFQADRQALAIELQAAFEAEFQKRVQALLEQRNQVFTACGLDTTLNYLMTDATETIEAS